MKVRIGIGPVMQRRLYGWATVLCILGALGSLVLRQWNTAILLLNLALSFQALWKTTVVEVKTDESNSSVEVPGEPVGQG